MILAIIEVHAFRAVSGSFSVALNYYDKNNIIHQSQIGFRPGFRTSDHIFTLRTLVDRYANTVKQGKIYAFFVVFKKLLTVFGTMGYYISCCPLESGVISLML